MAMACNYPSTPTRRALASGSSTARAASTYCARDEKRNERSADRREADECSNGERSDP
jgi:hypothetical protein